MAAGRETLAQLRADPRGGGTWCMKPRSPGPTRCGLSTGPRPPATRSRLCLSPCRAQTWPSGALPSARPRAGCSCRPRTCGGATSAASTTCPGWLRARTSRQSTTIRRKTGRWWRGSRAVTSPSGGSMRPMTCTFASPRRSRLASPTGPIPPGRSRGRRTAAHELPAGTMPLRRRVVTRARPWRPKPPEPRRRMFSPS